LRPFRLLACASPAYLIERGIPRQLEDLEAHECLAFVGARSPSTDWTFMHDGLEVAIRTSGRLRANNANALLAAALDGFGIAFIAEDLARSALSGGQLVRVLPDFDTLSRPMHLLFQADRRQTTKLRSFIDLIVQEIGHGDFDAASVTLLQPTTCEATGIP